MSNRHERRRRSRLSRDKLVYLQLLDNRSLRRLIELEPAVGEAASAAQHSMSTDAPALCAACGEALRAASSWGILSCGGRTVLVAICWRCDARPDPDLGRAVLAAAGASPVEWANVHLRGGRA
jgi:hypothetical protein